MSVQKRRKIVIIVAGLSFFVLLSTIIVSTFISLRAGSSTGGEETEAVPEQKPLASQKIDFDQKSISVQNLGMALEGILLIEMDTNTILLWQSITSNHMEHFYRNAEFGIKDVRVQTIVTGNPDDRFDEEKGSNVLQIEYTQTIQFSVQKNDETTALEVATYPFRTYIFQNGKEKYITLLKESNGSLGNVISVDDVFLITQSPTAMPSVSISPTANYESINWLETDGNESALFPASNISVSEDLLWKAEGYYLKYNVRGIVEISKLNTSSSQSNEYISFQRIFGETEYSCFGKSVTMTPDGSVLVVGARCADFAGTQSGSAYIYERQGIDESFTERQRLDGEDLYWFGFNVDVSDNGNLVVVNAPFTSREVEAPWKDPEDPHSFGAMLIYERNDNIDGLFELMKRFDGVCKNEFLGTKGVTFDITPISLTVHGKVHNPCKNSNVRIHSYSLGCQCTSEEDICVGFSKFPDLNCARKSDLS